MIIPHEDPNPQSPPTPLSLPVQYPKEKGLKWETFHPPLPAGAETQPLHKNIPLSDTSWKHIANTLHDHRTRFATHNEPLGNPRCSNLDRSAVLAIYRSALARLEHASPTDALSISTEARLKIEIILDLLTAEPHDPVFLAENAFLDPLEPQYAQPRLDYYDREDGQGDDAYFWSGWTRLRAWRREGWPRVYPARAVERERRGRVERRRKGRRRLRETCAEELRVACGLDGVEWGDEVDAEPGRPWR